MSLSFENQIITDNMNILYGKLIKVIGKYNNNYSIIIIKAPDSNSSNGYKSIRAGGVISDLPIGTMLKFTGSFGLNKKGSKMFKFNSYEFVEPNNTYEIIQYLSNQIDQVDYTTAKKICTQFGNDTVKILDTCPERLIEIKGLGKSKIDSIIQSWNEHRNSMNIHIELQKVGISSNIIENIKNKAIEVKKSLKQFIIENNYNLIYSTENSIFYRKTETRNDLYESENILTFDNIEKIFKIVASEEYEKYILSYKRIEAAIHEFIQHKNFETGNICQPYYTAILGASSILDNLQPQIISQILHDEYYKNIDHHIIIDSTFSNNNPNNYVIYCKTDYDNEKNIAFILINQFNNSINNFSLINNEDINKITNINYNDKQKNAIMNAIKYSISIITGGPGTGKTTIVKGLVELFENINNYKVLLIAPTSKAAKKMAEATNHDAKTIHMAICFEKESLEAADVIIVDETSMVDNTLMARLLELINLNQKIIFIGDINQLPSVESGNVLSDIINSNRFPIIILDQIYRQKNGNGIISAAIDINNGNMPNLYNNDDLVFIDPSIHNIDNYSLLKKILNEIKIHLNNPDDLLKEVQILSPVKKYDTGVYSINQFMQQYLLDKNLINFREWKTKMYESCPRMIDIYEDKYIFDIKKGYQLFCVGDRVVNIKNDYNKRVFNGEVGFIKYIEYVAEDKEIRKIRKTQSELPLSGYVVKVQFPGRSDEDLIEYKYSELDMLQLSYALTVHKSQGSEYQYVILFINSDCPIMLQRNLLYTAVTRAKNKIFIIGDEMAINIAVHNNNLNKRLTLLKNRLMIERGE